MKLHLFESLPQAFATIPPREIGSLLPGPSLFFLEGERTPPLFVSILLHGNETTGLLALQHLLKETEGTFPRSIILFVGNIRAAQAGVRKMDHEPDYNRIWSGGQSEEEQLASEVLRHVAEHTPLACIDMHNNTGKNPHYACVNTLDRPTVNLARRFSPTIVYFTEPHEVISIACSRIAPSVTLECGIAGEFSGTMHACDYLKSCLFSNQEQLFSHPEGKHDDVFHTVAKITLPDNARPGFGNRCDDADICFRSDFDLLNFTRVAAGTVLGTAQTQAGILNVSNNLNKDVTEEYFQIRNGEIRTTRHFIPAMFTMDRTVIHQDCLGYIMEPYPIHEEKPCIGSKRELRC